MRRLEIHCHTKEILVFTLLFALPNLVFAADETAKPKTGSKSAVIISNKIDLNKITSGKSLTSGKTGLGASAPIIVDKDATVIKGNKKQSSPSGLRGTVIMTSPKKK